MSASIGKDNIALEKKKQSALTKAVKKVTKAKTSNVKQEEPAFRKGIIMLNHIPHGFYEDELRGYFSSFGKVLRVRVGRSKKTGKSRGYAFVEFEFEEVAQIAAEAMNNYLMFERLIKCEVVSPDVDPKKIFRGRHIREDNCPKLKARRYVRYQEGRKSSEEESAEILRQRKAKLEEQNKKFAEMGLDYQFPIGKLTKMPMMMQNKEDDEAPVMMQNEDEEDDEAPVMMQSDDEEDDEAPVMMQNEDEEDDEAPVMMQNEDEEDVEAPVKGRKRMSSGFPKFSPKLLRSRKSNAAEMKTAEAMLTNDASDEVEVEQNSSSPPKQPAKSKQRKSVVPDGPKKTPEKFPKFSPKLLRSRKSQGPNVQDSNDAKQTPSKKLKASDLPKISPKLLRSRKSQGPNVQDSNDAKKTPSKKLKASDLPKISPKLLRSRKSDGAGLTPLTGKASLVQPAKQKKGGRKSVF